jgi:hypothetical protein
VYVAVKTKHLRSNSTKTMFVIIFFSDSNHSEYYPNMNMDSEALGCEYGLVVDRHFVRYRLCYSMRATRNGGNACGFFGAARV